MCDGPKKRKLPTRSTRLTINKFVDAAGGDDGATVSPALRPPDADMAAGRALRFLLPTIDARAVARRPV